jgi:hypothetical protein
MMVTVMVTATVMVMVMVLKALCQIGWLYQRQCQSFNILIAFYWPKLPQTQSFHTANSFQRKSLLLLKCSFVRHGSLEQAPK